MPYFVTSDSRIPAFHQIHWMLGNCKKKKNTKLLGGNEHFSKVVRLKQVWMWLSLRQVCTDVGMWCTRVFYDTFPNNYTHWILSFFLLTTRARTTSNCTSAQVGEQQFSRAVAPDTPTFSTDRRTLLQQEPSLQLCCGCKNKAAPCSTATGLLDPGHARLPQLMAKQAPGNGVTDSRRLDWTVHEHLDPFRRVYFGCSKHSSSTL